MEHKTSPPSKITVEASVIKQWDATFKIIPGWDSNKLAQAKVMVVGAGALGNEVLKNLTLLNVGHLFIVDFDTVEYANLCRSILFREPDCIGAQHKCDVAARRIREINPNVKVQTLRGDILIDVGLGIFRRMDVVIGCLDNRLARLFINRYCYKTNRVWIDGAIENLAGQLDVYKPNISCYECQLTDVEHAMIRYRLGCPDIAQRNAALGKIATTPISSSIIGAMQTQEALKVIYGNDHQLIAGEHFAYEGMNFMTLKYPQETLQEDCASHSTMENIIEAKEMSHHSTVQGILDWASGYFNEENPIVHLGHDVVLEITTKESGVTYPILIAKLHLSDQIAQQYRKIPGEDIVINEFTAKIHRGFPYQDAKLSTLGVPPLQILTVEAKGQYHFVELNGDEPYLHFT